MATGNPMILMMLVSLIVMVFFPKLLQGIDPEEMKQLQEEMNASGDPMKNLKKMVGMAPDADEEDEEEETKR